MYLTLSCIWALVSTKFFSNNFVMAAFSFPFRSMSQWKNGFRQSRSARRFRRRENVHRAGEFDLWPYDLSAFAFPFILRYYRVLRREGGRRSLHCVFRFCWSSTSTRGLILVLRVFQKSFFLFRQSAFRLSLSEGSNCIRTDVLWLS